MARIQLRFSEPSVLVSEDLEFPWDTEEIRIVVRRPQAITVRNFMGHQQDRVAAMGGL